MSRINQQWRAEVCKYRAFGAVKSERVDDLLRTRMTHIVVQGEQCNLTVEAKGH